MPPEERHHNHFVEVADNRVDAAWSQAVRKISERYPGATRYFRMLEWAKDLILRGEPVEL